MAEIHDRGRGPEIKGTRITVYDIMDYERMAWDAAKTAAWLKLTVEEVTAAMDYIAVHREELAPKYQKMLDRDAQGNPPELQAKIDALHVEFMARVAERRRAKAARQQAEADAHAGNLG